MVRETLTKRFLSNLENVCIKSWFDFMSGSTKEKPTGWSISFIEDCDEKILCGILEDEFKLRGIK